MITQCGRPSLVQHVVSYGQDQTVFRSEHLTDQLHQSLRATGYFVTIPCDVTVHVDPAGHVALSGIVPSFFLKQKAQIAVMSVDGVNSLRNEIVVM